MSISNGKFRDFFVIGKRGWVCFWGLEGYIPAKRFGINRIFGGGLRWSAGMRIRVYERRSSGGLR